MLRRALGSNVLAVANQTISDAVLCFNKRGRCVYSNNSGRWVMGKKKPEWIKKYLVEVEDSLSRQEKIVLEGEEHIFWVEFCKLKNKKGQYIGCYFRLNDQTIEIRNIEREAYRATHDELTGLYNRQFFFEQAEKILKEKPSVPRYLIATNIKNFKVINDLFGSKFGDNLLKHQAIMLCRADYEDCIHGRISGDKYAMLISKDNFNPELARKNTESIKELAKDINFPLIIQIGVYEINSPFENVRAMYDKACLALRNLKEEQNQTIGFYDTSLMKKLLNEKNIVNEFSRALENDFFSLFLQPQIDSKTEKCIGAEALVRWYDNNQGYRPPKDFIEILENCGLIYQLDHYIWEKAAKTLSRWQEEGFGEYHISVNISVKDFYYADLYKVFTSLVEKYKIPPAKLNLELTESIIIDNGGFYKSVLTRLQDYGFNIEMDDFGSGYSSLNVLKDICMDVLKIDMEFLRETENQQRGNSIIAAVVKMAKKLGMTVITEGVETEEQKNFLKDIGVDIYQGYLFAKPMVLQDFEHKYLGAKV